MPSWEDYFGLNKTNIAHFTFASVKKITCIPKMFPALPKTFVRTKNYVRIVRFKTLSRKHFWTLEDTIPLHNETQHERILSKQQTRCLKHNMKCIHYKHQTHCLKHNMNVYTAGTKHTAWNTTRMHTLQAPNTLPETQHECIHCKHQTHCLKHNTNAYTASTKHTAWNTTRMHKLQAPNTLPETQHVCIRCKHQTHYLKHNTNAYTASTKHTTWNTTRMHTLQAPNTLPETQHECIHCKHETHSLNSLLKTKTRPRVLCVSIFSCLKQNILNLWKYKLNINYKFITIIYEIEIIY